MHRSLSKTHQKTDDRQVYLGNLSTIFGLTARMAANLEKNFENGPIEILEV
jgi:hypothetical protein